MQDTVFGGFAPNSRTAETLSKALGNRTVLSGSVSQGKSKDGTGQSLQMLERPLLTLDELKALPKGEFVVMKTGSHPMRTRLKLFLDWGITFEEPYQAPDYGQRQVFYADCKELEAAIVSKYGPPRVGQRKTPAGRGPQMRGTAGKAGGERAGKGRLAVRWEVRKLGYFDSVYEADLSHRAKAVLLYLKDYADSEGKCWPGIRTIAGDSGLSRSTVKRTLDDLVRAGVMEKERRWRGNGSLSSNLYRVKFKLL